MLSKQCAVGLMRKDLATNQGFGSTFQFFVSLITSEILENLLLDEDEARDLAIKCVKRLEL